MAAPPAAGDITLGLLAGAGGPEPDQVLARLQRFSRRFPGETGPLLVRVRGPARACADAGMPVAGDSPLAGEGPLADVAALAAACATSWLLTLPVDVFDVNDCLVRTLLRLAAPNGAVAEDDDGLQPRVALYRNQALRDALSAPSAEAGDALAALQQRLGLARVRLAGVRFGRTIGAGAPLPILQASR